MALVPRLHADAGVLLAPCPCLATAGAARSCFSLPGPLWAAPHRAGALWLPAPGRAPVPSGLADAAQGMEPPASHVPHGSAAVPCLCHSQLRGACPSEEPAAPPAACGAGPWVPPSAGGSAAPATVPTAAIPRGCAGSSK